MFFFDSHPDMHSVYSYMLKLLTAKVFLPVAWDFALGFLCLFVAGRLPNASAAIAAVGHAFPILPFTALSICFGLFALFCHKIENDY